MPTYHIDIASQVIENISSTQITKKKKSLLSSTYNFQTSGKQGNCTFEWSMLKSPI